MRIDCPYCGLRPVGEFSYGGAAGLTRPTDDSANDTAAWVDYVYLRDNLCGVQREYWQHSGGCRAWLMVTRDTQSHRIDAVCVAAQASADHPVDRQQSP